MIEIISERKVWNATVELAEHYDFYHSYLYHDLSRKENEIPILIKYEDKESCVLLPLIIRDIEHTGYKDATSVYGYSGVLSLTDTSNFDNKNFKQELKNYFLENKIISVFARLHPYMENQETILKNLGNLINPGNVVYIDLTLPLDIQRQRYSSRLKTYVNKARKQCAVIKGVTKDHVKSFIDIYYDNMRRVNANESYFFEERYFYELVASSEFETDLLLCVHNETQKIIGGALFIKMDNIVQYHLSGYREDYFNLNTIKLIIDEMRIKATKEGYKYFNLGGGRSNKQDSLFTFKTSFSKSTKPFKLWRYIVDEEVYEDLVREQQKMLENTDNEVDTEFFPTYRQKRIKLDLKK